MSTLIAWIASRPVGELIRKPNGNLQLRYERGYDGPPISQALPLQEEAHPHARVRAVFAGLLPEGDVRVALARNLGVSQGNEFALLEKVGGDVAGAISLLEEGQEPPSTPAVRVLSEDRLARLLEELPQRPLAADAEGGVRLSLAGAQAKLPVIIDEGGRMALPTNSAAASTHILKPEPARFPGLVDNEMFCMALADACGLRAASTRKARTSKGLPYLVVERYDRALEQDPVRRIHQEDLCQALGLPPERKYQQEGGPALAQSAALVRRCGRAPVEDLPRLVRALVFNWIVGNCDAHGKILGRACDGCGSPARVRDRHRGRAFGAGPGAGGRVGRRSNAHERGCRAGCRPHRWARKSPVSSSARSRWRRYGEREARGRNLVSAKPTVARPEAPVPRRA